MVPGNYRPVSLTSIPCKVIEKIVRKKCEDYLYTNNLICDNQNGFVRNKSCTTNLLETLDYISSIIESKSAVDMIYLDFAKAFDTVPHKRLLVKLEAYGIKGKLLKWIEAFYRIAGRE